MLMGKGKSSSDRREDSTCFDQIQHSDDTQRQCRKQTINNFNLQHYQTVKACFFHE